MQCTTGDVIKQKKNTFAHKTIEESIIICCPAIIAVFLSPKIISKIGQKGQLSVMR